MKNFIESAKDFSPVVLAYAVLILGTLAVLHARHGILSVSGHVVSF